MSGVILTFGLLLACTGKDPGADTAADDSGVAGDSGGGDSAGGDSGGGDSGGGDSGGGDTGGTAELYGTAPETPVPLPDFSATNRDGAARGPADLQGHPTAMWFYPAAFTGG